MKLSDTQSMRSQTACPFHEELSNQVRETRDMMKEMYGSVVGNEKLGNRGLVARVKSLECYRSKMIGWTACIVGGGLVAWYFITNGGLKAILHIS